MVKVSVVITVFNGASTIEKSITSLLKQSFEDFEIIIVDDGSTDQTVELIKQFSDKRIQLHTPGRVGRARALNIALERSQGEYIAINDADDISLRHRLAKQAQYLDNNKEVALLGSWKEVIHLNKSSIISKMPTTDREIKHFLCRGQPIQHSTVMMRREVVLAVGGYNAGLEFLLDRDIFIRIGRKHQLRQYPESLVQIHRSSDQYFLNTYKGLTRERKSLCLRIKAILIFKAPIWWVFRELVRSGWTLALQMKEILKSR